MDYNEKIEYLLRGWDDEDPYHDENSKTEEELIDYIVDSEED
jgi:hypothetical protein